jgi:hypothetical protein
MHPVNLHPENQHVQKKAFEFRQMVPLDNRLCDVDWIGVGSSRGLERSSSFFQHYLSGAMTMRCNFPVVGFTHNICYFGCRAYVADKPLSMQASMKSIVRHWTIHPDHPESRP